MPSRGLVAVATCCAVGLLAACSSDPDAAPPASVGEGSASSEASTSPGAGAPIDEGGPLVALPECESPPEGMPADVSGLVLPDGSVVTDVQDEGKLVSVRAYVEQTPVQVREFYGGEPGLELFEIEDEVYEAEVLFGGGQYRSYVKVQAQCQQGSTLIVYVGPGDGGGLPTIGGE